MRNAFRRKAISLGCLVALTGLALAAVTPTAAGAAPELTPAAQDQHYRPPFKVLVFTGGNTPENRAGVRAIQELGEKYRFSVKATDNTADFDAFHLKKYRAVVFLNTSTKTLNDAARA